MELKRPLLRSEKGVILRLIGNRLAFSPPLIINEKQIGDLFACVRSALDEFH